MSTKTFVFSNPRLHTMDEMFSSQYTSELPEENSVTHEFLSLKQSIPEDTAPHEGTEGQDTLQKEETNNQEVSGKREEEREGKTEYTNIVGEENTNLKRKRKSEEYEDPLVFLTELFLRIIYPISNCMTKSIVVGISKKFNFSPCILLNHGLKRIEFTKNAWDSFNKYVSIIDCYLQNYVYGKKTCITLSDSDIQIETTKLRGEYLVRIRNTSMHDIKVLLNYDEFKLIMNFLPAVNRYLDQLELTETMIKEYLNHSTETYDTTPLLYGGIDFSIYNRLPQEVFLYRQMKQLMNKPTSKEDEEEIDRSRFNNTNDETIEDKGDSSSE